MFYWMLKWVLVGPLLKLIFRPIAVGTENVPATGPAILASNHLSYSDWLFMPVTIPRRVTFVAKAEYFTTPGIKGWLQGKFFKGAGQVPIDRSGGRVSEGAIKTGLKILGAGDLFGIYPEGTRSPDGRLYRGKTGVARMALEAKVPVIPLAVIGTNVVAPPGRIFGRYARPVVKFGKPLDFSRYQGMEGDRFVLRSITDEIMYEILEMSGQEYVDIYAARAKEEAQAEAKAAVAAVRAKAREAAAAAKEEARQAVTAVKEQTEELVEKTAGTSEETPIDQPVSDRSGSGSPRLQPPDSGPQGSPPK
ncbi:MAG: lysophospholipid acyltransferase family protein [Nocardioidaceae bacterium]